MRVVLPTLIRGWWSSSAKRVTFVALVCLMVAGGLFTRVFRMDVRLARAHYFAPKAAEVFYLPPVPVLKAMSLGHERFVSDLLFIQSVSYFIKHLFTDRIFSWLEEYLDRVVALDPYHNAVYEWAMKVVKYQQLITNDVIRESNHWASRGLEVFPDNWKYHLELGFNHYFEWDFADDEDRAAHQREAVDYFMIASSLPGSRLDPNFVTELYLRHNEKEMALFYALQRYQEGSDEEKGMLLERIAGLVSKEAARALEDRERAWKENFPYASPSLYDLLGPRREATVPLPLERVTAVRQVLDSMQRPQLPSGGAAPQGELP